MFCNDKRILYNINKKFYENKRPKWSIISFELGVKKYFSVYLNREIYSVIFHQLRCESCDTNSWKYIKSVLLLVLSWIKHNFVVFCCWIGYQPCNICLNLSYNFSQQINTILSTVLCIMFMWCIHEAHFMKHTYRRQKQLTQLFAKSWQIMPIGHRHFDNDFTIYFLSALLMAIKNRIVSPKTISV